MGGSASAAILQGKAGSSTPGDTMLPMYLVQAWFNLSDEVVEDAIYDSYALRKIG